MNNLTTKQQYANLAEDVYHPRAVTKGNDTIPIGGRDYKVLAVRSNPLTGYQGTVYQDVRTNAIIVAHRCTESPLDDWRDAYTDFNMAVNRINLQAKEAEKPTVHPSEYHQEHPFPYNQAV